MVSLLLYYQLALLALLWLFVMLPLGSVTNYCVGTYHSRQ